MEIKLKTSSEQNHPTIESYVAGFALSILLTLAAYTLVTGRFIDGEDALIAVILALAIIQLIVQLKFFLHLSAKPSQRWNLFFLLSMMGIVFILVAGSIWIMGHLNYSMTPPAEIIHDEGIHK